MQPPETDPTTAPSSRSAMMQPTGRGDEPQVRTTVASTARLPSWRQSRSARKTVTSRFSMVNILHDEPTGDVRLPCTLAPLGRGLG